MKPSSNNIFIDTNVLIGAYSNKQVDSLCLKYLYSLTGRRLFVSSLSIAQLVSVFQKKKKNAEIKRIVNNILAKVQIAEFSRKDIEKSLLLNSTDMEDNIQYVICSKTNCFHFVTNNTKDYSDFITINAIKPKNIRDIMQD
jgi:predicted nucleic acid-binding protein